MKQFLRCISALAGLVLLLFATPASAEEVIPSDRVVRWVNVREAPNSTTTTLATLKPGDTVELIEAVPAWYRVRLPDGREGYVSRAWTVRVEPEAFSPRWFLHLIDVGTGLAVFVEGPGFTLLYDAGSNDDIARGSRNRVIAYLRRVRPALQRIDHVILSHPHRDHVELLPDVLATYDIGNIWDSGRTNPICGYRLFLKQIELRSIAYHDAETTSGDHTATFASQLCYGAQLSEETIQFPHASPITVGGATSLGPDATMRFLHATAAPQTSFNENSLVVILELGRSRMLLMGDGEAGGRRLPNILPSPSSVEGEVITCCADALRSDILVVGHHGSKTSSRTALLDRAGAYVFLVSAGPTKYASVTLPDREVINELATRGTVYRTDKHDGSCRTNPAKIGPDSDGNAGGCDNVLVEINLDGQIRAHSYEVAD